MARPHALPPSRRPGHDILRLARRTGALIALALLAAPAAGSAQGDAARVILHTPQGDRTFSEADVRDYDVLGEDYVLRASSSQDTQPFSGISIGRLLEKAGYAGFGEGFVRLTRDDGTWVTLSPEDVGDEPPFSDGRKPLVFLDDVRTRFFRPVRDAADVNSRDYLVKDAGEPLEITIQTGRPLTVTATASDEEVDARAPVALRAEVAGEQDGEAIEVRWRFDDGSTAVGTSVEHAYGASGLYSVVATAEGAGGSGGASEPIRIRVGDPPATPGPGTAGGQAGDRPAPATGPQAGGPTTGSSGGADEDGTGRSDESARGGGRPGPRATATPAPDGAPAPTRTAVAPGPTPPPRASAPAAVPTPARRTGTGRRRVPASPDRNDGRDVVRGVLVGASAPAATVTPPTTPAAAAARAAAAAQGGEAPLRLPGAALTVVAILFAGALREGRGARRGTSAE